MLIDGAVVAQFCAARRTRQIGVDFRYDFGKTPGMNAAKDGIFGGYDFAASQRHSRGTTTLDIDSSDFCLSSYRSAKALNAANQGIGERVHAAYRNLHGHAVQKGQQAD